MYVPFREIQKLTDLPKTLFKYVSEHNENYCLRKNIPRSIFTVIYFLLPHSKKKTAPEL